MVGQYGVCSSGIRDDKAIALLKDITPDTHERHYLLAQSYFNKWDNESALRHIEKALIALPNKSQTGDLYRQLRIAIIEKRTKYGSRRQNKYAL